MLCLHVSRVKSRVKAMFEIYQMCNLIKESVHRLRYVTCICEEFRKESTSYLISIYYSDLHSHLSVWV